MRDATGSMQVFGVCLTFIIMFTAYLAITLNYAKAFRVKNHVISMIEERGGYDNKDGALDEKIRDYIFNQGLTATGKCQNRISSDETEGFEDDWENVGFIDLDPSVNPSIDEAHNVCIYRNTKENVSKVKDGPKDQYIYRVVTFFRFDIPVVRYFSSFQVAGESRYIYDYTVEE